jgi:hypothetical protein
MTEWVEIGEGYVMSVSWLDEGRIVMSTGGSTGCPTVLRTLEVIDPSTLTVTWDRPTADESCPANQVNTIYEAPIPSGLDLTKPITILLPDLLPTQELPVYEQP